MLGVRCGLFFFFKQKTAYEMRISDWSSDVCSSDLSGSLQALDLVNAVFVAPGDVVVVEEHTFTGLMGRLKKFGANCIGVQADAAGISITALARILDDLNARSTSPQYLYTITTIQNPTGTLMPAARPTNRTTLA